MATFDILARMPSPAEISAALARNLKQLRVGLGLTLDALVQRSGVSKGMLVQIEQARVSPSVGTLVKIADALGTNIARLVDLGDSPRVRVVKSDEQAPLWRGKRGGVGVLLCGSDRLEHVESWNWKMVPTEGHTSDAHPMGTEEFLYIITGSLTLKVGEERFVVRQGSSVVFSADYPHGYFNEDRHRPLHFIMFTVTPNRLGSQKRSKIGATSTPAMRRK